MSGHVERLVQNIYKTSLSLLSSLLGSGGQIHMRSWIEIDKVCSSCPKGICLRRGKDINNWAIYSVPGVGKEFLYSN